MSGLPREQTIIVPLDSGLDTGTDPQSAQALAVASNVTYPRRGAAVKRAGQSRSASAIDAASGPQRISRRGSAAVVWGGTSVQSYSTVTGTAYPASCDTHERTMQTRIRRTGMTVALSSSTTALQLAPSLAMGSTIVVAVYGDQIMTFDRATLTPIDVAARDGSCRAIRRADGSLMVVGVSGSDLRYRVVGSDGLIPSSTLLSTSNADVLRLALSGSDVYVLWRVPSGSIRLGVMLGGSPAAWSETEVDPIGGVVSFGDAVAIAPATAGGVIVAWSRKLIGTCYAAAAVYDSALAVTTSMATTSIGSQHAHVMAAVASLRPSVSGIGTVYATSAESTAVTDIRRTDDLVFVDTAGVGSFDAASSIRTYGRQVAASPMRYDATEWYVPWFSESWGSTYPDSGTHQGMVVISGSGDEGNMGQTTHSLYRPVASVASGYARMWGGTGVPGASDSVELEPGTPASGWACAVQIALRDAPGPTQRGDVSGLAIVEMWPSADVGRTVEHGGAVLLPGALPRETDGSAVYEQGWLQYPEPIVHTASSAGALTPGATYQYVATYECIDALGRRHMSAPTPLPVAVTPASAAAGSPTIKVSTLAHTLRGTYAFATGVRRRYGDDVQVVLWRTLANGSVYHRCSQIANDTTISQVSFLGTDALDSVIELAEVLPTTGGILAAAPPPPHRAQTIWQGRHVVVDDDRQELRYSRATATGQPIQHALELSQPLRLDGTVTALDVVGGRLAIFTDRAIYATDGAGLDDIGQGAPFTDPYLVTALVGCDDGRTVARIPQGLAFVGGQRVWLLGSGLDIQPLGESVRYYTTSHVYHDAVPVQAATSVAWLSKTGPALVYDAVAGKWSTWDTHACLAACASSSGVLRLDNNARVWQPSTVAGDDGAWTTLDLASGWIAIADWQRVAEIEVSGYYVSRCTIRIRVQYDYDPVDVDDVTITPNANGLLTSASNNHWGAGIGASYLDKSLRISHTPTRSQCSAIRIRLTDGREGSESLGSGVEWTTMRIRIQAEQGMHRLDSGRRTG